MASTDARVFPIKNKAFRIYGVILNGTTGNAITGGLTDLAATMSVDGAAFSSTGLTVAEIPVSAATTGYFYVDIAAAQVTGDCALLQVSASNANAVYWKRAINFLDLSEKTDHWRDQSTMRFEDCIQVPAQYIQNEVWQDNDTNLITVRAKGGASTLWTQTDSNASGQETKGEATS